MFAGDKNNGAEICGKQWSGYLWKTSGQTSVENNGADICGKKTGGNLWNTLGQTSVKNNGSDVETLRDKKEKAFRESRKS